MKSAGEARRYLAAFGIGFGIFGAFDLLYTLAGGQRYGATVVAALGIAGWPLHVPLQMGLAAVGILGGWSRLVRALPTSVRGCGPERHDARAVAWSVAPLSLGLILAFVLLRHELHASVHVTLALVSVLVLALRASRLELVAFCAVGLLGPAVEWLLLDPRLDYWRFTQEELFLRLPAWEPFVYGWVGVTIERLRAPE